VLFHHDSRAAPHTVQTASPVCGTKNFVSVRLYSAPQLHRTIVAIIGTCARSRPFSSVELCHNQSGIGHAESIHGRRGLRLDLMIVLREGQTAGVGSEGFALEDSQSLWPSAGQV
jgi:hypothetical protein